MGMEKDFCRFIPPPQKKAKIYFMGQTVYGNYLTTEARENKEIMLSNGHSILII